MEELRVADDIHGGGGAVSPMTKLKRGLLEIPVYLLGAVFLFRGFAEAADLTAFHAELLKAGFLPLLVKGLCVMLIPGLQLALGLILIGHAPMRRSAAMVSCLFSLAALMIGVCAALNAGRGCGACGHLEEGSFDFQAWKPVMIYAGLLVLSVVVVFIQNNRDDSDSGAMIGDC
jgi:hypothetical protein